MEKLQKCVKFILTVPIFFATKWEKSKSSSFGKVLCGNLHKVRTSDRMDSIIDFISKLQVPITSVKILRL
jgi:hypothetical protein